MNEVEWQKVNFILRIIIVIILLVIAIFVIYNRFGYYDPDDYVLNYVLLNSNVTCKEAVMYYAENEWGLDLKSKNIFEYASENQILKFNSTGLNSSLMVG